MSGESNMAKENKRLRTLMTKYGLTIKEVAELLYVSPVTVQHWRASEGAVGYRNMPRGYLELLKIKLGEK